MSHSWAHEHHTDRSHNAYRWELSKAHKTLYSFNNTFPDYGVKTWSTEEQEISTTKYHQWRQSGHPSAGSTSTQRAKQVYSLTVMRGHSTPGTLIIAQRVILSLVQGPDTPVSSKARGLSVGIQLPTYYPRFANPGVTGALWCGERECILLFSDIVRDQL